MPLKIIIGIKCTSTICQFGVKELTNEPKYKFQGIRTMLNFCAILGMLGEEDDSSSEPVYKLFTHKKFEIGYNGDKIVDVNLTSDNRVTIAPQTQLEFSYEVS